MSADVELVELPPVTTLEVHDHVAHEEMSDFLGRAFTAVLARVGQESLEVAGPPFGRYQPAGEGEWDVVAGFPVAGVPAGAGEVRAGAGEVRAGAGEVRAGTLPGGSAARTLHVGTYSEVGQAYEALYAWLESQGRRPTGPSWESYLDGPEVAEPRTEVFVACEPAATGG